MPVAIPFIVGAVVTAGATAYAAHKASSATQSAANTALTGQQQALQQQSTLSADYRQLGSKEIPTLEGLLGIGGKSPTATLEGTPGYQFQQQQGTQNTTNQATAMGMGLSGNTLHGLSKFNQGLADTTYQQAVGNAENVVGMGQAAAAGQAQNVGQAAQNTGNIAINQGNTLAGINMNEVAGLTKSFGGAMDSYQLNQTLAGLQNQNTVNP